MHTVTRDRFGITTSAIQPMIPQFLALSPSVAMPLPLRTSFLESDISMDTVIEKEQLIRALATSRVTYEEVMVTRNSGNCAMRWIRAADG